MMDSFLYSINATLPAFLMIILGKSLYKLHIIDDHCTRSADGFVFKAALPALVFKDLTEKYIKNSCGDGYVLF